MRPSLRRNLPALLTVVLAMVLVQLVRADLFETEREVKNKHDVYFLPPPAQVKTLSVGYRYAVADVLWAHVLVSQGLHSKQRRRFENLNQLYDVIYELAPKWRTPYLMADALLSFQAQRMSHEDTLKVREILERGTEELPYDGDIWLNLGQFVSFLAPSSYLEPEYPELAAQWRIEGTEYLARAAELSGGDSRIAWQALGGASILKRSGDQTAALRFLRLTYERTVDPALRSNIEFQIRNLEAASTETSQAIQSMQLKALRAREEAFKKQMREELPFVSWGMALLLGPRPRPSFCAGREDVPECAPDWRTWSERFDAERRAAQRKERRLHPQTSP